MIKIDKDKLDIIIQKQKELGERIIKERDLGWLKTDINKMIKHHVLALNDEVAELQREISWKWWANPKELDIDNIKEELIDIMHFNLQALILLGCDSEEIYNLYMGKNQENHNRQDGNSDRRGYKPNSNEKYENVD